MDNNLKDNTEEKYGYLDKTPELILSGVDKKTRVVILEKLKDMIFILC